MTDSRLAVHSQVFVDETTGIESGSLPGSPGQDYLRLTGDAGNLSIHLGWSAAEVVGNVDRLTAALAEVRTAAVAELGQDPADVDAYEQRRSGTGPYPRAGLCDCLDPICPQAHTADAAHEYAAASPDPSGTLDEPAVPA